MTRAAVISDEARARIEGLLPAEKGPTGRPSRPHRPVVEGMIYRAQTGVPWRNEPGDHGVGRSRGGLSTKAHALVDGKGRLLTLIVEPGQAGDSPVLPLLLGELRVARRGPGRPRTTPDVLRADRAYCSRRHRALLRSRGIKAVIPEKTDQAAHRKRRGSRGGRPVSHDAVDDNNRNVVERFFNRMKHWRGLASRYDNYAIVCRGAIVLAAIVDWLKHS